MNIRLFTVYVEENMHRNDKKKIEKENTKNSYLAGCLDTSISCRSGGWVAEWLARWTQAQKGPGSNRSRDAVG